MSEIHNPILRGFNPDPSIVRVEDDYYIATSTFQWFPGVQIHHSTDLVHWRLLTHPLLRPSQLDLRGDPPSGGVWAPDLSYHDGLFYLVYTDMKSWAPIFKDANNYVVTAPEIIGPWSEPVALNSSGFDPSLFHDDDGRAWLLNMLWDHRAGTNSFAGIVLQEYDRRAQRLVGPIRNIFTGTLLGLTEGPHLYRHDGWYHLLTAEGGTGYEHAVTMARARTITGPYEVDPRNPLLTSAGSPDAELQKAGHASVVRTQTDEWYLVHLCGRPLPPDRRCTLGRETAIQRCRWTDDGWLRLADGGNTPAPVVRGPDLPDQRWQPEPARDDFDVPALNLHLSTLRVPADDSWLSLTERPGFLRLRGRESLSSRHHQSLVARRLASFHVTVATCVEFAPEDFQQMAGLIVYYDEANYVYLHVSRDQSLGTCLRILRADCGTHDEPLDADVSIDGWRRCHLRATIDDAVLVWHYSRDGSDWTRIGPDFDASKLSDDYCMKSSWFTGAFVGMCVQDLSGRRRHADFDYFSYEERTAWAA